MLAPAKLNLGLEVAHRRPSDGYHYIASVFVAIDFGDLLHVSPAPQDALHTTNELQGRAAADFETVSERGAPEKNLVMRCLAATRALRPEGLRVELIKRTPTGAGLGGGSSDAGTLLAWMAHRYGFAPAETRALAASLGADAPFFLERRPSLVTGIGDIMKPIPVGPGRGVFCYPALAVSTPEAYASMKRALRADPPPETLLGLTEAVRAALANSDWSGLAPLVNDFEAPVFAKHPALAKLKASFYAAGAEYASLSGSGSCVYGLVSSPAAQDRLLGELQSAYPEYLVQAFQFLID